MKRRSLILGLVLVLVMGATFAYIAIQTDTARIRDQTIQTLDQQRNNGLATLTAQR